MTLGMSEAGPTVKPSVSLLPPSSLQISGDSAALLCLLSSYSPQGALVSWTLDGSEVTEGVQTSAESEQGGRYSRSSVLTLSKARWEKGELYVCRVTHDGAPQEVSFQKIKQHTDKLISIVQSSCSFSHLYQCSHCDSD
ncbi:Immunoglobulin lambda constant 7 [Labeo rohita]|nr:Immunoglobulin lambda constant 7 [Labeo rohita]